MGAMAERALWYWTLHELGTDGNIAQITNAVTDEYPVLICQALPAQHS